MWQAVFNIYCPFDMLSTEKLRRMIIYLGSALSSVLSKGAFPSATAIFRNQHS